MRKTLFLMIALSTSTAVGFARAGEEVMASLYGNTVIGGATLFGPETHTRYSPDHTLTLKAGGGDFKGVWKVDGTDLCRTFDHAPPVMPNPSCTKAVAHRIGESWKAGGRMNTLVKGLQ